MLLLFFNFKLTYNFNLFNENPEGHQDCRPWCAVSRLPNATSCLHVLPLQSMVVGSTHRESGKAVQILQWVSFSPFCHDCLHNAMVQSVCCAAQLAPTWPCVSVFTQFCDKRQTQREADQCSCSWSHRYMPLQDLQKDHFFLPVVHYTSRPWFIFIVA